MVRDASPRNQAAPGFRTLNPVALLRIEAPDGTVLWNTGRRRAPSNGG